VTQTAV